MEERGNWEGKRRCDVCAIELRGYTTREDISGLAFGLIGNLLNLGLGIAQQVFSLEEQR